jgi:hypothetical protein
MSELSLAEQRALERDAANRRAMSDVRRRLADVVDRHGHRCTTEHAGTRCMRVVNHGGSHQAPDPSQPALTIAWEDGPDVHVG